MWVTEKMFLFVIQRLEGTWGSAYLNFIALIWFFLYRYVCRTDIDLWHLRIVNIFFSAVESLNLALFNDVSKSSKRSFFNYVDKILAHYWPSTLLSLVEICHGIPFLLKFIFFKKATKIDEIFTVDLTLTT